jgi:hypothetical protein
MHAKSLMSKRVYKFLSAENALDDLEKRRMKISRIKELNDPFDLASVDTTLPEIRDALENLVKSAIMEAHGLLCFSRNWDNILLWSHYGCCHTGLCLGFDIPGTQPDEDDSMEVSYQPSLLKVRCVADINVELVQRLLRTKYEVWSYEQEMRWFVPLDNPPDEKGWRSFANNLDLKEVIVGCNCSREDSRKARQVLQSYGHTVELSWLGLSNSAFSLVRMTSPPDWQA